MDTLTDWRYSDEKMKLREHVLQVLLMKFGSELLPTGEPKYSNQKIYECAHDWVSQGNVNSNGIVKYFLAYYHEGATDKKAAKKIIKRYKKHPEWYTAEDVEYAKLMKRIIKRNEQSSTDQCDSGCGEDNGVCSTGQ